MNAPAEVPVVAPLVRKRRLNLGVYVLGAYTVLILLFLLVPIVSVVLVSFSSASFISFPLPGVGLKWYARILDYQPFMDSLKVSVIIAFGSALVGALLGVPAALWVARSRSSPAAAVGNLLLAPISVPAIVLGFSLLYYLAALGFGLSLTSLMIAHSVVAVPYVSRTALAVYRSMSPDLEEAAAVLGASRLQILRHISLPIIRPGIFAGALFTVLISLDNLPLSFFFGTSATNTLPVVMLSYMQNQFDPSVAAISTVQMLIAVITLLIVNWLYGIDKLTAV